MFRYILVAALVSSVGAVAPRAKGDAPTDSVVYHDFTTMPGERYGPYPETWMTVTASNSLALAVVPNGYHQTPHHHDQEQFTLAVEGALDYSIGGIVHHLGSGGASVPPANVLHGMSNDSGQPAMMLEFQPVRRDDWLPPHPTKPQAQSAQPMTVDSALPVTLDYSLASDGWRGDPSGARVKVLAGRTIRAAFWDLSAANASVRVSATPSTHERFVFVLGGRLVSSVGSARREVGTRTAIVVTPAATDVTLRSLGRAGTEVVIFERTGS